MNLSRAGKTAVAVIVVLSLLPVLVASLGIYNVAASAGHPFGLDLFLRLGMTRSVAVHSNDIKVPDDLQGIDRIRLGASHFQNGCAECHGTPGRAVNPVYEQMLPSPPDLTITIQEWEAQELYWIVLHGLQYTGMPAWSGGEREDEVWSMVAFLQVLPDLDAAAYLNLAAGNSNSPDPLSIQQLVEEGAAQLTRTTCNNCHDTPTAGSRSQLVPRLAGQSADYLQRSLEEYRSGERSSGFMQPVAAALDDAQIEALARFYSTMPVAEADNGAGQGASQPTAEVLTLGAQIAAGISHDIPACISCHGDHARNEYPRLAGQYAPYLEQQLSLWKAGKRQQTVWGEIMTAVASRLSDEQINALAVWFASQDQQVTGRAPN